MFSDRRHFAYLPSSPTVEQSSVPFRYWKTSSVSYLASFLPSLPLTHVSSTRTPAKMGTAVYPSLTNKDLNCYFLNDYSVKWEYILNQKDLRGSHPEICGWMFGATHQLPPPSKSVLRDETCFQYVAKHPDKSHDILLDSRVLCLWPFCR